MNFIRCGINTYFVTSSFEDSHGHIFTPGFYFEDEHRNLHGPFTSLEGVDTGYTIHRNRMAQIEG